jgi:hypothetical protein
MISRLFFVFIPLILIFAAPVFQLVLSVYVLKGRIKLNLFWVNLIALALGVSLPVCAMMISMYGLPAGVKCATGCTAFLIFGLMITIISFPIVAIFIYLQYRIKNKRSGGVTG